MDKNYKYAGKQLTERIAREHIIEIFSGKTGIEKKEIKQAVDETHTRERYRIAAIPLFGLRAAITVPCHSIHLSNIRNGLCSRLAHCG